MKSYMQPLLRHICLIFLLPGTILCAYAQEAKKLKAQTSATQKEIVYKPLESTGSNTSKATSKNSPKKPVATGKNKKTDNSQKENTARRNSKNNRNFIALKTNVPFDALAVQNLAFEVQVHKHITIDFPVMWSISDIEREHGLRTIAFQPEGRWWLKSSQEGGHFFGLHAHAAWFNLKWEDNRYQTEKCPLLGAGISYGYRLPLGKHWGAEFNFGFGYANMKYNTYYNIENGARIDSRLRNYWGITRAGLSLVYRF